MKLFNKFAELIIAIVCTSTLAQAQNSLSFGGRDGGGGDREAQWFANHAILLTNYYVGLCKGENGETLLSQELPGTECSDFEAIKKVLRNTSIMFKDKVEGVDGKERDAINNGRDQIIVSWSRWQAMKTMSLNQRLRIALHEYATIAGIESSDSYGFSGTVATMLPTTSPAQSYLDRVRFSSEYLEQLSDDAVTRLALSFAVERQQQLFGDCTITSARIIYGDKRDGSGGIGRYESYYKYNDFYYLNLAGRRIIQEKNNLSKIGKELKKLMAAGKCL